MKKFCVLTLILFQQSILYCQTNQGYFTQDSLLINFMNPPKVAKPRVWWHWMNGNITKDGIKKDLDWMSKTGIGGIQNFDASLFTPVVVKEKLSFMSPEWKDAFAFTTKYAKSKHLEMAIAGSPGWSVTGGPWVAPQDGMKKYVWTETIVKGGEKIATALPKPSSITGPAQNRPFDAGGFGIPDSKKQEFYQDVAVIAYPISQQEIDLQSIKPVVRSSGGIFSFNALSDGNLENFSYLPPREIGEDAWIQYEFPEATEIGSVTIANEGYGELAAFNGGPQNRSLQYSLNGTDFMELIKIPGSITAQTTVSFIPLNIKYIRLCYKTLPIADPGIGALFGMQADTKPKGTKVSEFSVQHSMKVHRFEAKAGFEPWKEENQQVTINTTGPLLDQIIDLTSMMKPDGSLDWIAPAGNWIIYRFGYSLTGQKNHPASPEATGLEVDKLDPGAVTRYLENYLDQYKQATGGLMGAEGLSHMVLDSYEAGHMTWTNNMLEAFKSKRGYDLRPWLPVLVGRIIIDLKTSEKILWDFRKTIGEMIVENHYELIGNLLAKKGMKRYTESHENGRIFLADGMDVKRKADIPMSAMWQPGALSVGADEEIRSRADIRESASVAHIYGQNIVAGESMTTIGNSFSPHPASLKRTADMELASGLNRFVIHTSVHQPLDSLLPGLSLGPFGQWFTRQETWADQAKDWSDYLARSSYLLQQGKFVADVLYFYGENTNITSQFNLALPNVPFGYEYDFANESVLMNMVIPHKGKIRTVSGMEYAMLVLNSSAKMMTLKVLRKILEFAKAGVCIRGQQPMQSPSFADDTKAYQATLKEIASFPNVKFDFELSSTLHALNIVEDIIITQQKSEILYVHRTAGDREIYWLNSRSSAYNEATISFRINGKIPILFNPITGKVHKIGYEMQGERTIIDLKFDPWDAYFIVFEGKTTLKKVKIPTWELTSTTSVDGNWKVNFQAKRGAPDEAIEFPQLISYTASSEKGIKYFSGTASYKNSFEIKSLNKSEKVELDLGDVKNLAEVHLNGKKVGVVWKKPFKIDVSTYVQKGKNLLEIKVINSWVNRLVGDEQPGVKKMTFTTLPLFNQNSPLEESGLLGPVKLLHLHQTHKIK